MPRQSTLGRRCALSAVGCRTLGFQLSSVAALCREAGHRVLHSPPTRQGMLGGSVLLSWRPHTPKAAQVLLSTDDGPLQQKLDKGTP